VSASLGPIRFNDWTAREDFRDWVTEHHEVDAEECEDWLVQAYFTEYEEFYSAHRDDEPPKGRSPTADDLIEAVNRARGGPPPTDRKGFA
jgi:hypothetical protein